jgi:glycosyltransferase involved in cell wall biosynthesis
MTIVSSAEDADRLALCCNPYHRGGIERFMADLAIAWADTVGPCWFVLPTPRTAFRSAGTSPTVASILSRESRGGERLNLIQPRVGPEFEFGTTAYRAAVYARALLDGVPEHVPVMTSDDPAAWQAAACTSSRNPCLLVVHGDYEGYYTDLQRYARDAAVTVAISRRIRNRILERGLAAEARVAYVPTGIALGAPRAAVPVATAAQLIWVGRMDESSKRVSDLPRLASILRERGVGFRLTLVGDGPSRDALANAVRDAGLDSCSHFYGWAPSTEVRQLLERSDVLLLPSNREGLPVAMMEALAAGCAVVASRVSGVEDYESSPYASNCLWVHSIGSVTEAANHVESALAISRLARSQRARAFAEAEFAIERCAQRYHVLIGSLSHRSTRQSSLGPMRQRLIRWASMPVAVQRRIRVWASSR